MFFGCFLKVGFMTLWSGLSVGSSSVADVPVDRSDRYRAVGTSRHDPSAKRFVAEFIGKGAEARAGSIGSIKVFCELMNFVDPKTSAKVLKAYQEGEKEYFKLLPEIQNLRKDKKRFDFERGAISALTIINEIMPILKKWFTT